jgi:hypothetical protein
MFICCIIFFFGVALIGGSLLLCAVYHKVKVPDTEVLTRAKTSGIPTLLQKAQLRWAGHVECMPDGCIPKQLMYSELSTGKYSAGGQKKRFKDSLKVSLKSFNINTNSWEAIAQEQPSWRSSITSGSRIAEKQLIPEAQKKRAARKDRTLNIHISDSDHICPTCGRKFHARIGIYSHLRTHRRGATTHV